MPTPQPLPAGKLTFFRHAPASDPALSTALSRYDILFTPTDRSQPPALLVRDALGFGLAVQELCDRHVVTLPRLNEFLTAAVAEAQADACDPEDRPETDLEFAVDSIFRLAYNAKVHGMDSIAPALEGYRDRLKARGWRWTPEDYPAVRKGTEGQPTTAAEGSRWRYDTDVANSRRSAEGMEARRARREVTAGTTPDVPVQIAQNWRMDDTPIEQAFGTGPHNETPAADLARRGFAVETMRADDTPAGFFSRIFGTPDHPTSPAGAPAGKPYRMAEGTDPEGFSFSVHLEGEKWIVVVTAPDGRKLTESFPMGHEPRCGPDVADVAEADRIIASLVDMHKNPPASA